MVTLTGMAKGSGMVHPNMATMFGLIASDVVMTAECLHTLLGCAVNHSFNCVTVDGDTSTNDACAIVATQVSGHETISDPASLEAQIFAGALSSLSDDLAEMLARDGEGARDPPDGNSLRRVCCWDSCAGADAATRCWGSMLRLVWWCTGSAGTRCGRRCV